MIGAMTTAAPPPVTVDLTWEGELRFAGRSDEIELVLDGTRQAGPSPVQALVFGLAACMAIDVVQILIKGRLPLEGLHARLTGERAAREPKRLLKIALHFAVTGDVPADRVERAIVLSREKYCSVWHSLRQDIDLGTSFEIVKHAAP